MMSYLLKHLSGVQSVKTERVMIKNLSHPHFVISQHFKASQA